MIKKTIKIQQNEALLIDQLQKEAKHQAELEKKKFLSSGFSNLSRIIALYPWQFLLISSLITTIFFEIVYRLRLES